MEDCDLTFIVSECGNIITVFTNYTSSVECLGFGFVGGKKGRGGEVLSDGPLGDLGTTKIIPHSTDFEDEMPGKPSPAVLLFWQINS